MFSPATDRNKQPIFERITPYLMDATHLLEIACGSLQHATFMAPQMPHLTWQPSDLSRRAIAHGTKLADRPENVLEPMYLDVLQPWPELTADMVFTANLLHISPEPVAEHLCQGSAKLLPPGGRLIIYGPFKQYGQHNSPGNAAFDEDLRQRNPAWGIRDLEQVQSLAQASGFANEALIDMPANNRLLVFSR